MSRPFAAAAAALLLLALPACSSAPPPIDLATLSIDSQTDANTGNALAVDVVLVLEAGLEADLLKMPARDWFRKRAQIARDNPGGLVVQSWELVPGQSVPKRAVETAKRPVAAVVYADYATPGDHRLRLARTDNVVRVLLQASDVVVQTAPASE
jgi:type VI secretion system protein